MFTGEHERLLDEKGRLVLPSNFRRYFVDSVFCARSTTDPCLMLFSQEEIERVAARLKERVRAGEVSLDAQRRWASSITEVNTDAQGRVAIPQKLRESAGLEREVVVVGVVDRAEVWNVEAWAAVESATDDDDSNEGIWL